ncbi:PDDEXK nuclease domain-containing protein [Cellvibrio sp. NN19]|uniref:PDDEXK nuclease domain-containing protein n=1 Tax=Cellvibrio chitinivorans TaxID=3102792 RepID=UPI002B416795|nr:PDDEXK nuclease domain-containing protein [Cellvibrio sp. NN19]
MANSIIKTNSEYKDWLKGIKQSFLQTQLKAAISVNTSLLEFYWQLGGEIIEKQKSAQWGDGFLNQLSQDLTGEFPDIQGFSKRNLELIRRWVRFWSDTSIAKQAVSQLPQIPWGHNIAIMQKCRNHAEALFYAQNTLKHGWSRNVLIHQIESGLYQRDAKAITNFEQTLPPLQSDLALQTLKDPYVFDFLTLTQDYSERELEQALTQHITQFLLELGAGFAYVGKQVPLTVGSKDFYLDLLFYHLKLRSYVVIELKSGDFAPEHTGKLNFYLTAIDKQLKTERYNPSIGLLLCKQKDKLVAEYALCDINKPIVISAYQLTQALPENLKSSLPSIEEIEAELAKDL